MNWFLETYLLHKSDLFEQKNNNIGGSFQNFPKKKSLPIILKGNSAMTILIAILNVYIYLQSSIPQNSICTIT